MVATATCPSSDTDYTCGLDAALRVVSGKWKPLILYFLDQGTMRFGELRRSVRGVSEKVLIQQLKEMQLDNLVTRTDHAEVPPRVDYALTPLGQSLAHALRPLCAWGTENMVDITRALAHRTAVNSH